MRRHLHRFLPVILTALMVQVLAPVAACWTTFVAASDPLSAVEICHSGPISSPADSDQGGGAVHDGACLICCVLHASASVEPPPAAILVIPYREAGRLVWGHHVLRFFCARTGSNSQARAPPQAV